MATGSTSAVSEVGGKNPQPGNLFHKIPCMYMHGFTLVYIYIYSAISLRGSGISEISGISGISGLRGHLAPQKHCYFTHGSHLSHFEATVRSNWLLCNHLEATISSKWVL